LGLGIASTKRFNTDDLETLARWRLLNEAVDRVGRETVLSLADLLLRSWLTRVERVGLEPRHQLRGGRTEAAAALLQAKERTDQRAR
jgi:hypothetical protein